MLDSACDEIAAGLFSSFGANVSTEVNLIGLPLPVFFVAVVDDAFASIALESVVITRFRLLQFEVKGASQKLF